MTMQRLKTGLLVGSLALLVGGCASAPVVPQTLRAEVDQVRIEDQSFTEFTAVARLALGEDAAPTKASWEILSGDEVLASGETAVDPTSMKEGVLEIAGRAPYADWEGLAELMANEKPLSIVMRGAAEDEKGRRWEFSRGSLVRVPRSPRVHVDHVEAAAYRTEQRIDLIFYVRIENRNPFPLELHQMTYDLSVNDQRMIENGIAGTHGRIPPATSVEFPISLSLEPNTFPDVGAYLQAGTSLRYGLEGLVELGVGRIPVELTGPIPIGSSR